MAMMLGRRGVEAERELAERIKEDWADMPEAAEMLSVMNRASANANEIERMDRESGNPPRDSEAMFRLYLAEFELEQKRRAAPDDS